MRSFFNTTNQKNPLLQELQDKAKTQEQKVLLLFKSYGSMGASQCWRIIHGEWLKQTTNEAYAVPITSIRRAITNLTKAGHLEKTNLTMIGAYGRPEYIYKLNK